MNKKRLKQLGLIMLLGPPLSALAASNINTTDKYAYTHYAGWVNFHPNTHGGVTVYNDHLEGYAWAENIGWIRLGTHTSGGTHNYTNTSQTDYGVNHDGAGTLSGYAWSHRVGWINFKPTSSGGVTIDTTTGDFDGYAWAENVGWIHFQNASPAAYKVNRLLPSVELSVDASTGTEAATTAITVTATASSAVTGDQTVDLAASGTGITSSDYTISGTTITITDGQTTGTVTFTIQNDSDVEGDETATLTISNPSAGITLGSTTSQNIRITDDDSSSSSDDSSGSDSSGSDSSDSGSSDSGSSGSDSSGSGSSGSGSSGMSPLPRTRHIFVEISGSGIVSSDPGGINCEPSHCQRVEYRLDPTGRECDPDYCAGEFETNSKVLLTPTPDEDFVFTGWGGHKDCVGSESESTAKPILGNRLCIAYFRRIRQLTVLKTGDGELTFYAPYETTCENDTCTAWLSHGMNVFLRALPKEDSGIVTWGGDCSGADQWQQVRMMADKVCTVTFE
jgi:hypothetical protein